MINSPCIIVCRINETTGLCEGCYRTAEEIATWESTEDQEKVRVLAAIKQRRASAAPVDEPVRKCVKS